MGLCNFFRAANRLKFVFSFFVLANLFSSSVGASTYKVALLGDSITYSAKERVQIGYPHRLQWKLNGRTAGKYSVASYGISSTTSSQHVTTWTNSIRNKGYHCLVILSGVNDMITSVSGATAWNNINTIVTQALGDGLVVVLVTVLPWGSYASWTSTKQTETDVLLASIRARAGVTLVDAYPSFETSAGSKILKASYADPDNLHLNTTGSNALADAVFAAIP